MSEEKKAEQEQLVVSDHVWARIVQIVQEGILIGVDVTDLMREIRLCHCDTDFNTLVLTNAYVEHVKESHKKLLEQAEQLKAQKQSNLIVS